MRKWLLVAVALVLVVSVPVTVMATGATHVKPNAFSGSGDVTEPGLLGPGQSVAHDRPARPGRT